MQKALRILIFTLLALAALKGLYHLAAQAWYFLNGAYAGDAKYYWTVGQAIRNGFTLYTDTYDTKPPAIYLLSALPHAIGNMVNGLMTLALPALISATAWNITRKKLQTAIALLFGITLTLYMGTQAEAWQVEWYGGFFGLLYVCLLAAYPNRSDMTITALLSIMMIGAIGFKEPFLFSIIAAGIIMLAEKKTLTQKLLVPLGITAITGVLLMLILGYLDGYIHTYLPSQFGHHIARSSPMLSRGIQFGVLGFYLWQFSPVFIAVIVVLIGVVAKIRFADQKALSILVCFTALYLVTFAGSLRGLTVNNHFVVAVPYYGALFFVWMKHARGLSAIGVPLLIAATLLGLPMREGFPAYAAHLEELEEHHRVNQSDADMLDAILDACDVERYFFVEGRPYMEYMRHSPLNFFVYVGPEAIVYHGPLLIEKQLDSFSNANIVIAEGNAYEVRAREAEKDLTEMTFRYLANRFTITPWDCAQNLPVPEGYSVLYRKDTETIVPFPYKMKE